MQTHAEGVSSVQGISATRTDGEAKRLRNAHERVVAGVVNGRRWVVQVPCEHRGAAVARVDRPNDAAGQVYRPQLRAV